MNNLRAFKSCLIDGWPSATIQCCAGMVMLDCGIQANSYYGYQTETTTQWLKSLNMPSHFETTSSYIANYYPRTSAALFGGAAKSDALKIFLSERRKTKRLRSPRRDVRFVATRTIRARQLTKNHDWNTVK